MATNMRIRLCHLFAFGPSDSARHTGRVCMYAGDRRHRDPPPLPLTIVMVNDEGCTTCTILSDPPVTGFRSLRTPVCDLTNIQEDSPVVPANLPALVPVILNAVGQSRGESVYMLVQFCLVQVEAKKM